MSNNKQPQKIKFSDFDEVETFVQINMVKGYRMINKLTEILDAYYTGETPPKFEAKDGGMIFHDLSEQLNQFRINSQSIWGKIDSSESNKLIKSFTSEAKKVSKIIDVNQYNRAGIRMRLLKKLSEEKYQHLSTTQYGEGIINNLDMQFELDTDTTALFGYGFVTDKEDSKGIIIDIDTFSPAHFDTDAIEESLKKLSSFYAPNSKLEELINQVLTKDE